MSRYHELQLPLPPLAAQSQNKGRWNSQRSQAAAEFFTVGYAGRDIQQFLTIVRRAGVHTIVDVRHTPASMYRPEFSKSNLKRYLEQSRIQYIHWPEWGVPRDIRALAVGSQTRTEIWRWYDANVVQQLRRNLDAFFNAAEHPSAFLCVESDPTACHRHLLALALEAKGLHSYDL